MEIVNFKWPLISVDGRTRRKMCINLTHAWFNSNDPVNGKYGDQQCIPKHKYTIDFNGLRKV